MNKFISTLLALSILLSSSASLSGEFCDVFNASSTLNQGKLILLMVDMSLIRCPQHKKIRAMATELELIDNLELPRLEIARECKDSKDFAAAIMLGEWIGIYKIALSELDL